MTSKETFGQRLKARRLELKVRQVDLAEHIGQTQPYVTQLEQDVVYLPQSIEWIAEYLNTYPETLLWNRHPLEQFTQREQKLLKLIRQVPAGEQHRILEFTRTLLSQNPEDKVA